ncbi:hypothetical protein Ddc_00503 [Ditylenchus destructor]|nr:hypothetical protein Ddc_00503 [Ditylenchus destructor]
MQASFGHLVIVFLALLFYTVDGAKIRLEAMSSTEMDFFEKGAQQITENKGFIDELDAKPKKDISQEERHNDGEVSSSKPEVVTPSALVRPADDIVPHRPPPRLPSLIGEEERDVENMLNLRQIPFITEEPTTVTSTTIGTTTTTSTKSKKKDRMLRSRRSSPAPSSRNTTLSLSTDDKEETDTAPPEVLDKETVLKVGASEDDFLKLLSQSKAVGRNRGGNANTFIDFDEALKATVPYNE